MAFFEIPFFCPCLSHLVPRLSDEELANVFDRVPTFPSSTPRSPPPSPTLLPTRPRLAVEDKEWRFFPSICAKSVFLPRTFTFHLPLCDSKWTRADASRIPSAWRASRLRRMNCSWLSLFSVFVSILFPIGSFRRPGVKALTGRFLASGDSIHFPAFSIFP